MGLSTLLFLMVLLDTGMIITDMATGKFARGFFDLATLLVLIKSTLDENRIEVMHEQIRRFSNKERV
jgi:hypothetical protein